MASIDDIKNKLNLEEMDKESRKKMFEKFVEKGGKVVKEKKPSVVKFNRDRQALFKELEDKKKKMIQEQYPEDKRPQHKYSSYYENQKSKDQEKGW